MKKHYLLSALLLLASCNTNGYKLHTDGDSEDGNNTDQIPDAQTLSTTWSHMLCNEYFQMAIGHKRSGEFASKFAALCEEKLKQGKTKTWAISYAAKRADGASEDDAEAFADNSTHSTIRMEAYQRMINKGKDETFAQEYAELYDLLRKDNKSHVFADQYAYHRVKGKSALFVTHFAEKVEAGKSPSWANAYAYAMEKTCLPGFATKMADAYIQQRKQGMGKVAAQQAACQIAAGVAKNDINRQDENKDTLLIKAARKGDISQVKTLLGSDADCNIRNDEGKTALMIAAEQGDLPIVASLLNADMMSVNIKDNKGKTAITWARIGKTKASKKNKKKKNQYNSIIRIFEGVAADESGIRRYIQRFVPGYDQVVSTAGLAAAVAAL